MYYTERTRLLSPDTGAAVETYIAIANIQVQLNEVLIYQTNLTAQGPHTLSPHSGCGRNVYPSVIAWKYFSMSMDPVRTRNTAPHNIQESNLNLNYLPDPLAPDLSAYPSPFFQRTFYQQRR
jgi:hypothetical protein